MTLEMLCCGSMPSEHAQGFPTCGTSTLAEAGADMSAVGHACLVMVKDKQTQTSPGMLPVIQVGLDQHHLHVKLRIMSDMMTSRC